MSAHPSLAAALLLGALLVAPGATAHEIRPGLLELVETAPGALEKTWKVPTRGDRALAIVPVLPPEWEPVGPPSERRVPGAWLEYSSWRSASGSLVGGTVAIDGLSALQTDVLLRIELADGTSHSAILRPSAPSFRVPAVASKGAVGFESSSSRVG